jgi:uncharacterized protein (UPF0216 family)
MNERTKMPVYIEVSTKSCSYIAVPEEAAARVIGEIHALLPLETIFFRAVELTEEEYDKLPDLEEDPNE